MSENPVEVSIIIIAHNNSEPWLDQCMEVISEQTVFELDMKLEIVVCNYSKNEVIDFELKNWKDYYKKQRVKFIITEAEENCNIGALKNDAIANSSGKYLCFQRLEDIMMPSRISTQFKYAQQYQDAIIGSLSTLSEEISDQIPDDMLWCNELKHKLLKTRIYTKHGATIPAPTWFCHRSVYDNVGGFSELVAAPFDDLIFFYKHLDSGGNLIKIDEILVKYPYQECTQKLCPIIVEKQFLIQLSTIEISVFSLWETFTIWNSCKRGRRVVRNLTEKSRKKVKAFCDTDESIIGTKIDLFCPKRKASIMRLPVVLYSEAKPLLLICAPLNNAFEKYLKTMHFEEGVHYIIFN